MLDVGGRRDAVVEGGHYQDDPPGNWGQFSNECSQRAWENYSLVSKYLQSETRRRRWERVGCYVE